ncbi:histidine phosphatase family protein [bacterium]|nr:histidine phosphatase family protein [bacterium]MBU1599151.1 histidine phosphatase family protein [bacterium]
MELYLIRHGESNWNRIDRVQGQSDPYLSKKGKEQAEVLAERLKTVNFSFLYSSHLKRAYQTAKAISSKICLPIKVDQNLSEIDLGEWEGKYAKTLWKENEVFREWFKKTAEISPPLGETLFQFRDRIDSAFSKLITLHKGEERGVVVTHSGAISIWLAHLLGMDFNKIWSIPTSNASITIVRFLNPTFLLASFNDTSHLREIEHI